MQIKVSIMRYSYFKMIVTAILFAVSSFFAQAQQTDEKFVLETQYLLYLPDQYTADTATKWPLLIFLHGSGESGTDLNKVKVHGPPKLVEQGKKFPFIVVSPQAPPRTGWKVEILKAMLDDLKKRYRVDHDRVYLTGLSMGGFGTWNLSEKYPDEFAAIAPICGGGDAEQVWKLRHMPVLCFHGAKDDVVPPAASQKMIDALKEYNSNVRFTLYPDANHNSWDVTYNNDSLYSWLLAQKRFRFKPVDQPSSVLKNYEGVYVNNVNKDTVKMVIENEKLVAKIGKNSIELKASANDNFFWDDNSIDEVQFTRDKKKKTIGFLLLADEKVEFRKLATEGTVSGK